MAEGDHPLRGEMEKVRERTRLQALSQGANTREAEERATAAVAGFCAKWGIRVDASGNPAHAAESPSPVMDPAPPPAPAGLPRRAVDLGSSPLRPSSGPQEKMPPLRVSELLRRGRVLAEGGGQPASARPSLNSLLERLRNRNLPPDAAVPSAPPPPASAGGIPPLRIRHIPVLEQAAQTPGGEAVVAAAASLADRRRRILDEFDRTYEEVQAMIEARILESQGEDPSGAPGGEGADGTAPKRSSTPANIEDIARDLERLRGGLESMLSLCNELMFQLAALIPQDDAGSGNGGEA